MFITVRTPTGQTYKIPASQVEIRNDDGWPVALAYERDELIIYSDANDEDFGGQVTILRIKRESKP